MELYDFRIGAWLGIALLSGGAALAALNPALLRQYPQQTVTDGQWAATYTREFEAANPVRDLAITSMAAVNFALFREGRSGLLVGDRDWLYTAEEMTVHASPDASVLEKTRYIAEAARVLERKGVRVIVALLPAKIRIYPEHAGSYRLLPQLVPVYPETLARLRAVGIEAPDLWDELDRAKAKDEVFLRTDTHWTPFGAHSVARAVSRAVGANISRSRLPFRSEPIGHVIHEGDLLNYLPLGQWRSLGPKPDIVESLIISAVDDDDELSNALLGSSYPPIGLVGTSYSFNVKWGFEQALELEFGAPVLNISRQGRGPFKPMQEFLDDTQAQSQLPKVLIWEIPERYLWSTNKQVGLPG